MRNINNLLVNLAFVIVLCATSTQVHAALMCAESNLVVNGTFEQGTFSPSSYPDAWLWNAYTSGSGSLWADNVSQTGDRSVSIISQTANDVCWIQNVPTQQNTLYYLSGWVKTENVAHSTEIVDAGANVSLLNSFIRSPATYGTNDWARTGIVFNSQEKDQVTVAARLGFYAGTTTGTAWFDDVRLTPIVPIDPHPRWNILVLIYRDTNFTFGDNSGVQHHVMASMTQDEVAQAADAARQFVEQDIPELTGTNMLPRLTIRYPERALTALAPNGAGWWPAPENTASELDPAFDSVIVIWDPRGTDQVTGQPVWIGSAAGLTPAMGTGQTYMAIIIEAAISYGHRNVFKHEYGHSITEYFNAAGVAPKPKVENHAVASDYVNCLSGTPYVWEDETDANPIRNSIYSNASGFTHDYYSGTTAMASEPTHCLGINRDAWALGGPVSHSGTHPVFTPTRRVFAIMDQVATLVAAGQLDSRHRVYLKDELESALSEGGKKMGQHLRKFVRRVESLLRKEQMPANAGELLIAAANAAVGCLQ